MTKTEKAQYFKYRMILTARGRTTGNSLDYRNGLIAAAIINLSKDAGLGGSHIFIVKDMKHFYACYVAWLKAVGKPEAHALHNIAYSLGEGVNEEASKYWKEATGDELVHPTTAFLGIEVPRGNTVTSIIEYAAAFKRKQIELGLTEEELINKVMFIDDLEGMDISDWLH